MPGEFIDGFGGACSTGGGAARTFPGNLPAPSPIIGLVTPADGEDSRHAADAAQSATPVQPLRLHHSVEWPSRLTVHSGQIEPGIPTDARHAVLIP